MKFRIHRPCTWVITTSLLLSGAAWAAQPVSITNAGFEDPVLTDGSIVSGSVPGWTAFNGGGIAVLNPSTDADLSAGAPEGENVAVVTSTANEDGLSQTLTSPFQADATYALTVKVANSKFTSGFPGYRVQLIANGTVLAEDDNSQAVAEDTVITSVVNYSYDAGEAGLVGQPLEIRLLSKGLAAAEEVAFDDVQLSVTLTNPAADPGGPYTVPFNGSLSLDGSGSLPSDGQTITAWEWDLDNDGDYDEAITGATPTAISYADLQTVYGMTIGANTIKLRVTDDSSPTPKTTTAEGTVNLSPPLVIYEPFADLDPTLSGNTPGLGLAGTWTSGALVADSSLTYGRLGYQGGRVVTNPANQVESGWVSPGTTLTDAGLMADGATLWFSVLIVKYPDTSASTNDRTTYFSLGTGVPDGFDRIGGNNGSGFAVVINQNNNGSDRIQGWNNNSAGSGGAFRSPLVSYGPEGETILAVGKITWGEFNVTDDVFELYVPDKDLNLGSPVSTLNGNFDQLGAVNPANAFDTIGFAGKRGATGQNNVPEVDEIRFGANFADVLPLDFTDPVLVSTDNPSGSGVQRVATFDEELYAGTGDIRIVNETTPGTTTIPVGDPQIVLSGKTLTITPTTPLGGGTYHIEIDAGALTDRNLNEFAGISDPDLWEFTVDDTAPTVASFGDNTFPKPILTNSSILVYTVTFSEPINAGSVDVADFAATAGSVPITVDSVSATDDPTVFDIAVTTGGTTGTLALEIVQGAVITDLNGNNLDTTTAIASDNTLTVNDPTPNAGSISNDFQTTIASQSNPNTTGAGEGRYFHVSVNPANAGTGWYCANLPGTNDPAPAGVRYYTGPVVAYKMLGNTNNSVSGTAGAGGDDARITYETQDAAFDAFGQQQMRLWTDNDPGADLATGAGTGATGFASVGNYGYRDWSGATGIVDISGLASGSVHIYYGSYNSTPTVKVIMRDTDNVGADIVLNDVHSIADGGNGDAANFGEYYLAEIDFVTDGVYDVIIYEWTSPNGRGLGTVLTGPDVITTGPFADWAVLDGATGVTFGGDANGDGVQDGLAFLLGAANPNIDANAAGLLPTATETAGGLQLTFNCLPIADRGTAQLRVQHSTDLATWTTTVDQVPDVDMLTPDNDVTFEVVTGPAGPPALNTVTATIDSAAAGGGGKLFGRLQATE